MKKYLILIGTLTLIANFANAGSSPSNYILYLNGVKIKSMQLLDESHTLGESKVETTYQSGANSCNSPSSIIASVANIKNDTDALNWVKEGLASYKIDWVSGNMAASANASTPSKLNFAIKVDLTLVAGVDFYECKNIYLGMGTKSASSSNNWWFFSNNNKADKTISCNIVGNNESATIQYSANNDSSFSFQVK